MPVCSHHHHPKYTHPFIKMVGEGRTSLALIWTIIGCGVSLLAASCLCRWLFDVMNECELAKLLVLRRAGVEETTSVLGFVLFLRAFKHSGEYSRKVTHQEATVPHQNPGC